MNLMRKKIFPKIFLIRHGQRADCPCANLEEKRKDFLDYDPPLTDLGILQSKSTGKFISNLFKKQLIMPKFSVYSSPFLRFNIKIFLYYFFEIFHSFKK